MKIAPEIIHSIHSSLNKTWIFNKNIESWHRITMKWANTIEKVNFILDSLTECFYLEDKSLEVEVWNMKFKNPVWLAAGFAKQSHWLKTLEALWFGYLTIWWITEYAQSWNREPRIFKFNNTDIVNGMWLPGDWIDWEVKRLYERKKLWLMPNIPIIANLCNSARTTDDCKTDEFLHLMDKLYLFIDWFEVNVSCPNQCWVTSMQQEIVLHKLLTKIKNHNKKLALRYWCERKTILVKIAPLTKNEDNPEDIKDLTIEWLELIANVCNDVWIDWVTATNTSQEHNYDTQIIKPDKWIIKWWRSWLWLNAQSLRTVRELRKRLVSFIPVIWVWWIGYDKWQSWVDMINAWATSIEILSSLVQNSIATPYFLKKAILESKEK